MLTYYEKTARHLINKNEKSFKTIANILRVDVKRILNDEKIDLREFIFPIKSLAMIADSVSSGNISVTASKEIFNQHT